MKGSVTSPRELESRVFQEILSYKDTKGASLYSPTVPLSFLSIQEHH